MPIYEYDCENCGSRFETYQSSMNTEKEVKCPECESDKTRRVLSTFFGKCSTGHSCGPTVPS